MNVVAELGLLKLETFISFVFMMFYGWGAWWILMDILVMQQNIPEFFLLFEWIQQL